MIHLDLHGVKSEPGRQSGVVHICNCMVLVHVMSLKLLAVLDCKNHNHYKILELE